VFAMHVVLYIVAYVCWGSLCV